MKNKQISFLMLLTAATCFSQALSHKPDTIYSTTDNHSAITLYNASDVRVVIDSINLITQTSPLGITLLFDTAGPQKPYCGNCWAFNYYFRQTADSIYHSGIQYNYGQILSVGAHDSIVLDSFVLGTCYGCVGALSKYSSLPPTFFARLIFGASGANSDTVHLVGNIRNFDLVKIPAYRSNFPRPQFDAAYDLRGQRLTQKKPAGITILLDSRNMLSVRKICREGI